ncbi:unnamed protein product [Symbiodinium natans]|uniref:Uncharacterized protein n=1 Tax=Symbiodinium natans TaxID=878477 RepID=A0A812MBU1_9DINO|nr:unnamed protein product [Symbiodinium natans]
MGSHDRAVRNLTNQILSNKEDVAKCQERLGEMAGKLEGQKRDLGLLRIAGSWKSAEHARVAEEKRSLSLEEQDLIEEVEGLKQALERSKSRAVRAPRASGEGSLPLELLLPRRLARLRERVQLWEDLIRFRQYRLDQLREQALATQLQSERLRAQAAHLREEAARLRAARQRADEALSVAKEEVRWARSCRRYAFFLPVLSSLLTSLWWCYG